MTDDTAAGVCFREGCCDRAAVRLYVPGEEPKLACPAHARAVAQGSGVVAEPLEGAGEEWP